MRRDNRRLRSQVRAFTAELFGVHDRLRREQGPQALH